jgi:hypothetical protein
MSSPFGRRGQPRSVSSASTEYSILYVIIWVVQIQELCDRAEIDDVLKKYYRGVDRTDYDLVRSCFFEDAHPDYGPFFKGGLDEFIEYLQGPMALGGFTRTFHFAGNTIIELDGDVAHTEVYVMAQHTATDDHAWAGAFVTTWLRYADRFERRDGAWRIAQRHVVVEWVRRDTAGGWEELPPEAQGRRDRGDAIYAR